MEKTVIHAGQHGDVSVDDHAAGLPAAEFDGFAPAYSAGMENPLKRLVGRSADDFIAPKARWLLRRLRNQPIDPGPRRRLLDFGCGTGRLLSHLQKASLRAELCGCDVSARMLEEMRRTWDAGLLPLLRASAADTKIPFEDGEFDVVVASSVLHHVSPTRRPALYQEIARVLRPGGLAVVFEHNPYHPAMRWVVRTTPIDRNAILLPPREVRAGLCSAGLSGIRTGYLLFFPPGWPWLRGLESWLWRLPLGGQYAVDGVKQADGQGGHSHR